jgi:hypothetical protein
MRLETNATQKTLGLKKRSILMNVQQTNFCKNLQVHMYLLLKIAGLHMMLESHIKRFNVPMTGILLMKLETNASIRIIINPLLYVQQTKSCKNLTIHLKKLVGL